MITWYAPSFELVINAFGIFGLIWIFQTFPNDLIFFQVSLIHKQIWWEDIQMKIIGNRIRICKVQIIWEGHKNLKKISHFVLTLICNNLKKSWEIFFKFCGLLTKSELCQSEHFQGKSTLSWFLSNMSMEIRMKTYFNLVSHWFA